MDFTEEESIVFRETEHPEDVYIRQEAEINYGIEVGEICPICKEGQVMDLGGCNTCNNPECGAQLKCGL